MLVNNAGRGLLGAVEEASDASVRAVYEVNVFGALTVQRAVLPVMRRQRSGHIINISSVGGLLGSAGWGIYCSTKFAVEGFSEALAQEVQPLGIPGHRSSNPATSAPTSSTPPASAPKRTVIADYEATVGATRAHAAGRQPRPARRPDQGRRGHRRHRFGRRAAAASAAGQRLRRGGGGQDPATLTDIETWRAVSTSTDHDDRP